MAAHWDKATSGRDPAAAATVMRALDSLARLHGTDAAMRIHLREGISEQEFAGQLKAVEESLEPGSALRALASGEVVDAQVVEDDDIPWSNLGGPVDDTPSSTAESGSPPVVEAGPVEAAEAEVVEEAEEVEVVEVLVPLRGGGVTLCPGGG